MLCLDGLENSKFKLEILSRGRHYRTIFLKLYPIFIYACLQYSTIVERVVQALVVSLTHQLTLSIALEK